MIKYMTDNDFPNFKINEFKCLHGVGSGIYYSLGKVLQDLRDEYGSITISSGYRCPECNAVARGASNSAHLLGAAADFRIDSGYQDNLENRKKLVTTLRKTYNVHYAYCKVDDTHIWDGYTLINSSCNMNMYIHVDTNPIYTFTMSDITKSSVKVSFLPDRDSFDYAMYKIDNEDYQNLPIDNIIKNLEPGKTYKIKLKLRFTGSNSWIETEELLCTTKEVQETPIKEEKEDNNIITPDKREKLENEPLNEEIKANKNIIQLIIEFIIKIFKFKG